MANNAMYRVPDSILNALSGPQGPMGMSPNVNRLSLLPRYNEREGLVAPQWLYDLARAVEAPGNALMGHQTTPEEAVNFGLNFAGAGLGSSAMMKAPAPGPGKTLPMALYPGGLDDAQKQNFHNWFRQSQAVDASGNPLPLYHGTQRADRIGDQFQKKRATSGPMAFFTDDPEIASSYATGKVDTSLEVNDYADWFRYKPKGARSSQPFTSKWWEMSPDERQAARDALYQINDDDARESFVIGQGAPASKDHVDYLLKQHHGNALAAAKDLWLDSGLLYDSEDRFLEILKNMGVKGVEPDFPNVPRSGVYQTYLSIQKPLDTSIFSSGGEDAQRLYSVLEQAGKRKRAKYPQGYGADMWDKNNVSGTEWLSRLKYDMDNGTTHAWTSIPDWVTEELKRQGFDGIKDVGGKSGNGPKHAVWIPFDESQVKSAIGNKGTFDPAKKSLTK